MLKKNVVAIFESLEKEVWNDCHRSFEKTLKQELPNEEKQFHSGKCSAYHTTLDHLNKYLDKLRWG